MALNFDAAMRVVAKVQGLNEFKALSEGLGQVNSASKDSKTGLQQLSAESNRLTQEAAKTVGSVKAQATALQELQTRTRSGAAEMRRMGEETRGLGSAVTQLRGQSAGAMDGLTGSATKAANSIRQLQGALAPTDEALAELRNEVLALGASSKQTERSLEQQVQVLKNLRSQAELNGDLYNELTNDMQRLTAASKGMADASMFGVEGMKKLGAASQSSAESIEQQIKSLTRLQSTLVKGGEGYRAIGKEIDALKQKAATLDLAKGLAVPGGGVGAAASGVSGALAGIAKLRQELAKTNPGRVVLAGEGLAAAGLTGAAGAGVAGGIGSLAAGAGAVAGNLDAIASKAQALPALLRPLGNLLAEPAANAAAGIAQWGAQLSAAQGKIAALAAPFEAVNTAISAIGPEAAAAAGAASLAIASVYQVLSKQADRAQADAEQAFKGISDDAQRMLESLSRLYDRLPAARLEAQQRLRDTNLQKLGELDPSSVEARQAANAVAVAEREIAKIRKEQNDLLEQARQRQNAAAEALQRQVQTGRQEISQARERLSLAERVAQVQRQAADRRRDIAAAEKQAADAERNRLGAAAAAAAQPRVLALPAAGQTSAPGTGQAMSGGARLLSNFETAGTRDNVGAVMAGFSGEARAALNQQAAATDKARESLSKLFIEIDKVEAASNGSVNSLQRQRAAWEALRIAVNPAAPAYEQARAKVKALDEQLQKLTVTQQKATRSGIGREAVGGALGALATGGGFQAAIGSFAGSLAFSGGAAGLAAGGLVTAVGGAGALATRVGLEAESAQVRLKALTDQFGEYNQAQASAATIAKTLRISTTEAQTSFSNLYASLRPTGISIKELEDAYIGFTAAARNSGATAQESANALQQLKQGLASGALQGDELRSVREQAPLVAQAIAKEFGVMNKDVDVSIGNLKEFAAEGKITTDVVISALGKLRDTELKRLGPQLETGAQAIKDFQIAVDNLGKRLAEIFGPAALAGLRAFTRLLERTNDLLTGEYDDKTQIRARARDIAGREAMARFSLGERFTNMGEYRKFFLEREKANEARLLAEREARLAKERGADKPNADQLKAQKEAEQERERARTRAAREAAAERLKEELKIRKDAEKRLGDAVEQRDQQLRDFRLDTIKRAKDLERQLGDQRLQIEREIEASRLAARRAVEDRSLEGRLQERRAAGLSTDAIEEQKALNALTRQFEDQITQARQSTFDRQQALQRQLEEFKISIAEGIGKIQEAYARSVSSILKDAGEKLAEKMVDGAKQSAVILGGAQPGATSGAGVAIGRVSPGGSSIARTLIQALGITPAQAAGIVGNLQRESGLNPRINEGGFVGLPLGVGGYGLAQWTGSRQQNLRRFAGYDDSKAGDLTTQVKFLISELLGPESRALAELRKAVSPEQAAVVFDKYYERSGIKALDERMANARAVYQTLDAAPGSSRQLIGGGAGDRAVAAARQRTEAEGQRVREAANLSQQESRRSAFESFAGGIDQRFSGATAELDSQARSAKEKLEDERMYQLLLSQGVTPELAKQRVELERIATTERTKLQLQSEDLDLKIKSGKYSETEVAVLQTLKDKIDARIASQGASIAFTEREIEKTKELKRAREEAEGGDIGKGLKDGVKGYLQSIGTLADGIKGVTGNAIKGLEDQLVNFVTTGKANFAELARSILADMARIAIQQMVLKPILNVIGGPTGLFPKLFSANGNVFDPSGVVAFANGGVVTRPTLFPFANGGSFATGVMGEAGPEAIMPLRRGRDGKLGVAAAGGGAVSVTVNVDAQGSQVQGNPGQGEALGRAVAQAVQAELIRQKRPGGLLAA